MAENRLGTGTSVPSPRHAVEEDYGLATYWQQVAEQGFDPFENPEKRADEIRGRHRRIDDELDNPAYLIPTSDDDLLDMREVSSPEHEPEPLPESPPEPEPPEAEPEPEPEPRPEEPTTEGFNHAEPEHPVEEELTPAGAAAGALALGAAAEGPEESRRPKLRERIKAYFKDPESGRRRLAVAALAGALALVGIGAVLAGKEAYDSIKPPGPLPTFTPASPSPGISPTVSPGPSPTTSPSPGVTEIPPPAEEPPGPAPPEPWQPPGQLPETPGLTKESIQNLWPENYNGQPFEWGAVADQVGPQNATPTILGMIEDAQAEGVEVDTWGDIISGYWGVTAITVNFPDGTQKTVYDTPRKLAILQHFSQTDGPK